MAFMLVYPQLAGLYELDDIFAGGHSLTVFPTQQLHTS